VSFYRSLQLSREQLNLESSRVASDRACLQVLTTMNSEAKSCEEFLTEAAECDRLARLARSEATRRIMILSATAWRKLAQEAVEREMPSGGRRSN
jgi:hypothetical protein